MRRQEQKILESLTLNDLQESHREIAEVIGVEAMVKLSKTYGGNNIYIPQSKELIKNKIYEEIYEEFDGSNLKELTVKYNVSKSTVYNIVRDKILKGSSRQLPGQMSIADLNLWLFDHSIMETTII